MKTQRKEDKEKNLKNKSLYTSFPFIALGVVLIAALLFFVWHQKSLEKATQDQDIFSQNLTDEIAVPEQVGSEVNTTPSSPDTLLTNVPTDKEATTNSGKEQKESTKLSDNTSEIDGNNNISETLERLPTQTNGSTSTALTSTSSEKQNKFFQNIRCQETTKFIEDFFQHLDDQQYLKKYEIQPDSKTYFIALMQRTLDNPPVVSGETDDLYTILQNTAHFFRIIGNTNIAILKNILSNEKAQFENIAANFYSLVTMPACAENNFGLTINNPSLYEYAGFFLNTMGGRLYLFRRDSISRMVISYYSILLIDRANIESFNKHGIELSTSIDLLISEMESTTNTLKLKETYLNTLYALQEQYHQ